jgi:hypothetical protein
MLFSCSAGLNLRVEQTKGDHGSRMHELSQIPRADHFARAEYEKPIRARSDLEMVRTLKEMQHFTASEEFVLLGIVRTA